MCKRIKVGDEKLPAIGQGCMGIGGRFIANLSRDAEQIAALQLGIDLGMNFIDTAEGYGAGHSEELAGEAVEEMRNMVFLASKVSPSHLTAKALVTACEGSLRRLRTDRIDLYQIHWPNPAIRLEETLEGLARLREQGKIRHIGVSNFSLPELRRVRSILDSVPLFSVQSEYNLFERGPEEELIPWCSREGSLFIAYSPLDQGRLVGNAKVRQRLFQLADEAGCTPGQLALAFLASRGPVLSIPKATAEPHIRENAGAMGIKIPTTIFARMAAECMVEVELVSWRDIRPVPDKTGGHAVYTTIEEARANLAGHTPSPRDLADEILRNDRIKPIRVTPLIGSDDGFRYDLAEGRLRFWAWVIAFNGERDVPVLIRN